MNIFKIDWYDLVSMCSEMPYNEHNRFVECKESFAISTSFAGNYWYYFILIRFVTECL